METPSAIHESFIVVVSWKKSDYHLTRKYTVGYSGESFEREISLLSNRFPEQFIAQVYLGCHCEDETPCQSKDSFFKEL